MSFLIQSITFLLIGTIIANGRKMISNHIDPMSDQMIDEINQLDTTWKVSFNLKYKQKKRDE